MARGLPTLVCIRAKIRKMPTLRPTPHCSLQRAAPELKTTRAIDARAVRVVAVRDAVSASRAMLAPVRVLRVITLGRRESRLRRLIPEPRRGGRLGSGRAGASAAVFAAVFAALPIDAGEATAGRIPASRGLAVIAVISFGAPLGRMGCTAGNFLRRASPPAPRCCCKSDTSQKGGGGGGAPAASPLSPDAPPSSTANDAAAVVRSDRAG